MIVRWTSGNQSPLISTHGIVAVSVSAALASGRPLLLCANVTALTISAISSDASLAFNGPDPMISTLPFDRGSQVIIAMHSLLKFERTYVLFWDKSIGSHRCGWSRSRVLEGERLDRRAAVRRR
jgi:hypothetical protein